MNDKVSFIQNFANVNNQSELVFQFRAWGVQIVETGRKDLHNAILWQDGPRVNNGQTI